MKSSLIFPAQNFFMSFMFKLSRAQAIVLAGAKVICLSVSLLMAPLPNSFLAVIARASRGMTLHPLLFLPPAIEALYQVV